MFVTGLGSMPGRDFRESTRMVADLQPGLLAWPEVPARDAPSTMIGRALGLLEQPCELSPDGWRLASRPDAAQRRARRWWGTDLDDFEELTQDHTGGLKVALAGPWTLAASVRLSHPTMNHIIGDHGACRDLSQALAEAAARLATRLVKRLGRRLIVQLDEPVIDAVLAGALPTFSGLHRYPAPKPEIVADSWHQIVSAVRAVDGVGGVWVHSCGPSMPVDLASQAGFTGLCLDARYLDTAALDACGAWLSDGGTFGLGLARTDEVRVPSVDELTTAALRVLRVLEIDPQVLDDQVVLTPACGLAGWDAPSVARLFENLNEAAGLVSERLAD